MNRRLVSLAAPLSGLLLVAVVASPVMASLTVPASSPAATTAQSDPTTGIARCLDVRATARTSPGVGALQAVGLCEIDRRLDAITRLQSAVNEAGALTDTHKASLTTILSSSTAGLTSLRGTIAADTTILALRTDIGRIFTDYRVYALVARQVHIVRCDDRVAAAADRETAAASRLAEAIAKAKGDGKDTTVAQQHLDAMSAAIAKARSDVDGDAAVVLAQTPAGWNAGTAGPILDAARASVAAARTDLTTALTEAKAVLAALA